MNEIIMELEEFWAIFWCGRMWSRVWYPSQADAQRFVDTIKNNDQYSVRKLDVRILKA